MHHRAKLVCHVLRDVFQNSYIFKVRHCSADIHTPGAPCNLRGRGTLHCQKRPGTFCQPFLQLVQCHDRVSVLSSPSVVTPYCGGQGLDEATKMEMAAVLSPVVVLPSHDLCRAGDRADCLWLLQDGTPFLHLYCWELKSASACCRRRCEFRRTTGALTLAGWLQ